MNRRPNARAGSDAKLSASSACSWGDRTRVEREISSRETPRRSRSSRRWEPTDDIYQRAESSLFRQPLHLLTERGLGVEVDRDELREPGLLHGDAVENVGRLHGLPIVGDDEELGPARQLPQHAQEPMDVGVVEGRIHLVENAERARPEVEDREQERQARQRTFAAREQRHGLQPFAPGLCHQIDTGVERVTALFGLDQPELGPAPLEETLEELAEVAVDLLERLSEALLRAPRHATQRLFEVLDRGDEVVVLRLEEREPLVEFAVLVVGNEVHGPDRGQLLLELGDLRPGRSEVAGRVVVGGKRRRVYAIGAPRLLAELLPAHPALGRAQIDLVDRGDEPCELAVNRALVGFDRAQLSEQPLVVLRRLPHLGVLAVALDGDFARARVRALSLLGEPGSPVGELALSRPGLLDAPREVTLDVVDPRELAAQRLHTLGGGRHVHAARRRLRHQLRLAGLRRLDRLAEPRHPRFVGRLGVARAGDARLELAQGRDGLLAPLRDLARLGLDRLAVAMNPLVLAPRLLEILLAREPGRVPRAEGPLDRCA